MKVLVADKFEQAGLDGLRAAGCVVVSEPAVGADGLAAALAREKPGVLIVRSTKVLPAAIAAWAGLKLIVRAGAGVDNIDLPAAAAAGVAVANCPGMNAVAVAELAMLHLLNLDRRLVDQVLEIRSGSWNKKEYGKARGLKGLTLGVVGLGSIGKAVARRAGAFEMRVAAWDVDLTPARAKEAGVAFGGADRPALLAMVRTCDAISIHIALVPATRHFCNAEFFAAMKPGAYFINTSRGGVVDEAALRQAVTSRGIRAGLDVYENQPPNPTGEFASETLKLPGVYGTHHCGASTEQAQNAVAAETVRIVRVFKETGTVENAVSPAPGR